VTVLSPAGGEYREVIDVRDDYDLPKVSDRDDWIEIEGSDGSVWAMPPRLVVAIVLEAKPKKTSRGGRIN
jgi:hypothetical protein